MLLDHSEVFLERIYSIPMANWHAYLNISTSKSSPYEGGKALDEARAPKGGKRWGDKPQDDSLLRENHLALHW